MIDYQDTGAHHTAFNEHAFSSMITDSNYHKFVFHELHARIYFHMDNALNMPSPIARSWPKIKTKLDSK